MRLFPFFRWVILRRPLSIGHSNFVLKILANLCGVAKTLMKLVGKLYFAYNDPQFANPFVVDFAEEILEPDEII